MLQYLHFSNISYRNKLLAVISCKQVKGGQNRASIDPVGDSVRVSHNNGDQDTLACLKISQSGRRILAEPPEVPHARDRSKNRLDTLVS